MGRWTKTPEETKEEAEARAAIIAFFRSHFDAQARGGQ